MQCQHFFKINDVFKKHRSKGRKMIVCRLLVYVVTYSAVHILLRKKSEERHATGSLKNNRVTQRDGEHGLENKH